MWVILLTDRRDLGEPIRLVAYEPGGEWSTTSEMHDAAGFPSESRALDYWQSQGHGIKRRYLATVVGRYAGLARILYPGG